MAEDIIAALSRFRWFFVIARNSSFMYKGRNVHVRQIGRELGVRYALEGSVRKSFNRLRITAQLVEAATGAHLWAEKYDGAVALNPNSAPALSLGAALNSFAGRFDTVIDYAQRPMRLSPFDPLRYLALNAFGRAYFFSHRYEDAIEAAQRAIRANPRFAPAYMWLVAGHVRLGRRRQAEEAMRRQLDVDPKFRFGSWTGFTIASRDQREAIAAPLKEGGRAGVTRGRGCRRAMPGAGGRHVGCGGGRATVVSGASLSRPGRDRAGFTMSAMSSRSREFVEDHHGSDDQDRPDDDHPGRAADIDGARQDVQSAR